MIKFASANSNRRLQREINKIHRYRSMVSEWPFALEAMLLDLSKCGARLPESYFKTMSQNLIKTINYLEANFPC